MSHYIRSAVKEYSDLSTVRMLQLIEALRNFYRDNRDNVSKVSINLNNAVKRANELALSDLLSQTYFTETLKPQIINTRIFLDSLTINSYPWQKWPQNSQFLGI